MGSYKGSLIAGTPHNNETNETTTKVLPWVASKNNFGGGGGGG